jgi:hypothetical protein
MKEGSEILQEWLMWGGGGAFMVVNSNGVERCGFSSGEIEFP